MWLIKFKYDYYCQGIESTREYALVQAPTFKSACAKIAQKYQNARDFICLNVS